MIPKSKESTPEYTPVPIKSLINSFEQGKNFLTTSAYRSSHIIFFKHKKKTLKFISFECNFFSNYFVFIILASDRFCYFYLKVNS